MQEQIMMRVNFLSKKAHGSVHLSHMFAGSLINEVAGEKFQKIVMKVFLH